MNDAAAVRMALCVANWTECVNMSRDILDCTSTFTQQKARALPEIYGHRID